MTGTPEELITAKVIAKHEADQPPSLHETQALAAAIVKAVEDAQLLNGWLRPADCAKILGTLRGKPYARLNESPVYKSIERGTLKANEAAGAVIVELQSFIEYLRNFEGRIK